LTVLSVLETVVKIGAVLVAALWAYYHYFRGRMYRSRIEMAVTGDVVNHPKADYVIVRLRMKNVGLSQVEITQRGTGVRVSTCMAPDYPYADVDWEVGRVFPAFLLHECIESGEPIEDRVVVALPQGRLAVRLEFRVVSGDLEWNTQEIVSCLAKPESTIDGSSS
jgi:hypothetical protein